MTIFCNATGTERKRLAYALGGFLNTAPTYLKAPTYAYAVGDYTVDKDGNILCPDSATAEDAASIIAALTDLGFTPEISADETSAVDASENSVEEASAEIPAETPDVAPATEAEAMPEAALEEADVGAETPEAAAEPAEADPPAEDTVAEDDDETKLTISIPRDKLADDALARLRTIVSNKEELFKRALKADALPIEVDEEKIAFPWFTLTGINGEAAAYAQFLTNLCKMATEQTRVLDKPYDGDNDRFAMRIFMVRLGMKGPEFALARKLMMKHLEGNSGWRYENGASGPKDAFPTKSIIQHLKKGYPLGTWVELVPMENASCEGVQIGAHGRVASVDDNGTVFITLDNSSVFGIAFSSECTAESMIDVPADDTPANNEDITAEDAVDSDGNALPTDIEPEDDPDEDESEED